MDISPSCPWNVYFALYIGTSGSEGGGGGGGAAALGGGGGARGALAPADAALGAAGVLDAALGAAGVLDAAGLEVNAGGAAAALPGKACGIGLGFDAAFGLSGPPLRRSLP